MRVLRKTSLVLVVCAAFASGAAAVVPPVSPLGLNGYPDATGRAFTIAWEPVRDAAVIGYNVYRRISPTAEPVRVNSDLVGIPVFADRTDGGLHYYSIRSVDAAGAESGDSYLIDSSAASNLIYLADEGRTRLVIPGNATHVMRATGNRYGVPLSIALTEHETNGDNGAVRSVSFQLIRSDNGEEARGVAFGKAGVRIEIGYNFIGGQVARGAPGDPSPRMASDVAGPEQLSVHWFNGVDWIKLGGAANRHSQTVGITTSHLGRYELRTATAAQALALPKPNVFPGLFTPNGDGLNDRVYIVLENPNDAAVQADIIDLSGRLVASLPSPSRTSGSGSTFVWNGQDASGSTVGSGLYLYRIEGEGKTITGTVSVAR